jgi:hypothetical protein
MSDQGDRSGDDLKLFFAGTATMLGSMHATISTAGFLISALNPTPFFLLPPGAIALEATAFLKGLFQGVFLEGELNLFLRFIGISAMIAFIPAALLVAALRDRKKRFYAAAIGIGAGAGVLCDLSYVAVNFAG